MASLVPYQDNRTLTEKLAVLDKIANKVNEKAGKIIIGRIGANKAILDRLRIQYIPTPSYELNDAIGGGFPRRRCTIVSGLADSGKTSLALETIAFNMKNDPNFIAIWLESENSLEEGYIVDTFGIDPDRFFYIEVESKKPADEILDILYNILSTGIADICVINSLKCLIPTKEREASLFDTTIALQARLNSRMVSKFTAMVAEYNTAFVLIQRLSTDIGSMSRDPLIVAGGLAIRYWSSLTLDLRKKAILDSDPIGKDEGVKIGVRITKNHCAPWKNVYVKLDYYAIFGQGIEQYLSTLARAISKGIIVSKGAWLYWYDEKGEVKDKWNGKIAFRQAMKDNPDIFNELLKSVGSGVDNMSEDEIEEVQAETAELEKISNKKSNKKEQVVTVA